MFTSYTRNTKVPEGSPEPGLRAGGVVAGNQHHITRGFRVFILALGPIRTISHPLAEIKDVLKFHLA
jgi:hypothetical protein